MLKRALICVSILLGGLGCGPNRALVRQRLAASPHHRIAILPADVGPGQKNNSRDVTVLLETKLRNAGFTVADHNKAQSAFSKANLNSKSFENVSGVAQVGKDLGVQAVLTSRIDQAYERVEKHPAVYEFVEVPGRACCYNQRNPCPHEMVYDPMFQGYADSCGVTHRRVQLSPAQQVRLAGLSLRTQLIDVSSQNVLWTNHQEVPTDFGNLYNLTDRVTDALSEHLVEDFLQQGL